MLLLMFVYLICTASTCFYLETPLITLVNNSDKSVVFNISKDYPDTLVSLNGDAWYIYIRQSVTQSHTE